MHRYDAACHWCGVLPKSSWTSPVVWRSAAALLITVAVAGAAWNFGSPLRVGRAPLLRAEPAMGSATVATASVSAPVSAPVAAPVEPAAPVVSDSAVRAVIETDSIVWTAVVARTWVNVRISASRDSDVVGVIKPASRALLGTGRSGWRQVRSPDISGWVDPRHFDPDSLRTRSE